jgi:hypothetical protein
MMMRFLSVLMNVILVLYLGLSVLTRLVFRCSAYLIRGCMAQVNEISVSANPLSAQAKPGRPSGADKKKR